MAKLSTFERRRQRVRTALRKNGGARPRLSVHRTGMHTSTHRSSMTPPAKTVAAASTLGAKSSGSNISAATQVGADIAAAAKKAGVTTVVFDRGGFLFHGRVKALADAAREGGLEF